MMTVSAEARLMPKPPALVERRKANWGAPGAVEMNNRIQIKAEAGK